MQWIAILVLALASNLDNLGIGIGLGLKRVKLPWTSNALIAGIAALATGFATYGGRAVALLLPKQWANLLGGLIIIAIGIWVIRSGVQTSPGGSLSLTREKEAATMAGRTTSTVFSVFRAPVSADADRSGSISWKEALLLGIALGINCLAGGFAAGLTHLPPAGATILTAIFSYLLTDLGVRIGHYAGEHWFGRYSPYIAGLLLVLLGVYECLS